MIPTSQGEAAPARRLLIYDETALRLRPNERRMLNAVIKIDLIAAPVLDAPRKLSPPPGPSNQIPLLLYCAQGHEREQVICITASCVPVIAFRFQTGKNA
jgi:hypothetical protein